MALDQSAIAETIKAAVAQIVGGINAHDPIKPEGFKPGFQLDPVWKVGLIDEAIDVAGKGDMAVYRGTYNEDNVPMLC